MEPFRDGDYEAAASIPDLVVRLCRTVRDVAAALQLRVLHGDACSMWCGVFLSFPYWCMVVPWWRLLCS